MIPGQYAASIVQFGKGQVGGGGRVEDDLKQYILTGSNFNITVVQLF